MTKTLYSQSLLASMPWQRRADASIGLQWLSTTVQGKTVNENAIHILNLENQINEEKKLVGIPWI